MIVIAVLLLAAVVALIIGAFLIETDAAGFEIFQESFTISGGTVFAAGVAVGLLTVALVVMLRVGIRRSVARRREIRELRAAHARTLALEREREPQNGDAEGDDRRKDLVRPYVGGKDRPGAEPGERALSPAGESPTRDYGRPSGGPPPGRSSGPGAGPGATARFDSGPGPSGTRRPLR